MRHLARCLQYRPTVSLVRVLLPLLALFLVAAPEANAARTWCRTDPIITINGELADIFTLAPVEDLPKITGATQIVVVVPTGVSTSLIATDAGFGYGETVEFRTSESLRVTANGIEVVIRVYVPAKSNKVPIRVEFAPRAIGLLSPASATGTTNSWVVLKTIF
jgi:hypothetical protein